MDAAAEIGKECKHQIQPIWRMSRLTRDGTAEPVSQDKILKRERGQGADGDRVILIFCVQLTTSRIGNLTG